MADFFAPYRSLDPVARLVATAFGIVYPHTLMCTQLAKVLRRARLRHQGRLITNTQCKAACGAGIAAGAIRETAYSNRLIASGEWAPWLTAQAFEQGTLGGIVNAFRSEFPPYLARTSHGEREMMLRCHTVAGRFERIRRDLGRINANQWRWLARPGVASLLTRLPPEYVEPAFSACLDEVVLTAAPPEPILEAYGNGRVDRSAHAAAVAFIHALRGSPADALAVFADLPGDVRESRRARAGLASTRALLATLRGEDAEAIRYIDEAVAAEKAGTRKRNVFPAYSAFTLSLLSLVRDHTPGNAVKADRLLEVGGAVDTDSSFRDLVLKAGSVRNGRRPVWSLHPHASDINRLCEGWIKCWTADFTDDAADRRFIALCEFARKAARGGYRWLAAESLEVCGRWWRAATGRPELELSEVLGLSVRGEPVAATRAAALIHRDLGTATLASLIAPAAEWEYILRGVEQIAYETSMKRLARRKAADGPRRLVWVLDMNDYGRFEASPREQRTLKSGRWSKGRPVSLQRLWRQAGTMDFLLVQDRAAAGQIVHNTSRWNDLPTYYLPAAGICALAGHPYVFNGDGEPVEVVRRDPELLLREHDGVLTASVFPHVDGATTGTHNILMVGDARCEVTHFTPDHKKLCAVIPRLGIDVPVEARERLADAVSALAGEIRVQGAIGDASRAGAQVEADLRPWVRLEPSGPGLTVALLVQPVPDSGTYFRPGIGGTTAFATVGREVVQARRDLEAETRAAQELMVACPMLLALGPELSLTLPDPEDCLELVDQLGAADARCLWPKGQPFRVQARADASSLRLSVKSATDWFSAYGSLAVDADTALDLRRLFELIDQNPSSRFVPLGEGSFVSLTAAFQRQLADLRSVSAPSGKDRIRLHGLAALTLRDFFDGTELTADGSWRTRCERFRDAQAFEPMIPGTLQAELRPYQEQGFRWMARLSRWGAGACLADDMGLGKTVQTLAVLLDRAQDGPALVVAPTSVVANWLDEARRFAPTLNVGAYTGPAASRADQLEDPGPFDVLVTTYGLLHIDVEALAAVDWSTVVLDEAQAIKNPATKRARAARKLDARFRVVTTGTPIQNNVVDLYSLLSFVNPGMLGSLKRFRENFALPIERNGDPAARMRLRRLIAPFVLRRLKSDVLDDLPPRTEVTLEVEMSSEEASFYEALRQRALEDLGAVASQEPDSGKHRMQVLAHLTRLRLACCHPRLVHPQGPPSSKLRTFATTLDELRQGRHKVLVFSQFVRHLRILEEQLIESGIPYQYLDGATPAKARAERIAAFQAGQGDAFLISLKAGGVGLNLTAADYVIHMDPWWNPAAEDQASDRTHRIGQTRPVTVYRLVAKGTIEEQIVQLHRHKRELADRLLEGADTPARLSTDEMLELLRGPGM